MINTQIDKEKKQLLRTIKKMPNGSRVEWNKSLGWLNSKDKVDLTKIRKRLKQLEADGFVIQIGHRYVLNYNQS